MKYIMIFVFMMVVGWENIKQSIGILPKKDILVMNDFEGIFGLEQFIPDFIYILCPNSIK